MNMPTDTPAEARHVGGRIRPLLRTARAQGWEITLTTNGHLRWYVPQHLARPGKPRCKITSNTDRAYWDLLRDLQKLGLECDDNGEYTPKKVVVAYSENRPVPTAAVDKDNEALKRLAQLAGLAQLPILPNAATVPEVTGSTNSGESGDSSMGDVSSAPTSGPEATPPQGTVSVESPPTQPEDIVAKSKRRDLTELRKAVEIALQGFPGTVKLSQIIEKVAVKHPYADGSRVSWICKQLVASGEAESPARGLYRWAGKKEDSKSQPEEMTTEQELGKLIDGLLAVTVGLQEWAKRVQKQGEKDAKLRQRVRALLGDEE